MEKQQVIEDILHRGVEDIFVLKSLKEKLESGKKLRVKFGIDPTGAKIHLGRAIPLRKLRDFQKLGHTIVLIVGDFTARIGDPSDKLDKRPMLSVEEIESNMKDYRSQIGKILDIESVEFRYNSEWLSKLTFEEVTMLAETFTVQQMISRRNFKERIQAEKDISLREFLYPLMQGYDSVAVEADIEIGGLDQLFNLKAGRTIQEYYQQTPQDVLTTVMLEGTDGRKMSTSWGNVINIIDEPHDMFGKIMSLRDDLIVKYLTLCTDVSHQEIKEIEERIASGENPKESKVRLAREIVSLYHGEAAATEAEAAFAEVFSKKNIPQEVETVSVKKGTLLAEALLAGEVISSKSDFKRLVDQGAVSNLTSDEDVSSYDEVAKPGTYRVGKKRFIAIVVE